MARPPEPAESAEPAQPAGLPEPAPDDGDGEPTQPLIMDKRWTGSAAIPDAAERRRRRRGVQRDPTDELTTVDDESWPPPPPPRPANAPVTAPYPPSPLPGPPVLAPGYPPYYPGPWYPPRGYPAGPAGYPHGSGYPPYGYGPPAYPVALPPQPSPGPAPPRRRRRWPWVLGTLLALTLLCCGCCVAVVKPYVDEYPATASLPTQVAGLSMQTDAKNTATAADLKAKVRADRPLATDAFAAVYAERGGRLPVTIFGVTTFGWDPEKDLQDGFRGLTEELALTDITTVDPGPPGGHIRCANGSQGGATLVACGWADHGSLAVALFPGRNIDTSAELLREFRTAIITRG